MFLETCMQIHSVIFALSRQINKKMHAKTINLLCVGNNIFVTYQIHRGVLILTPILLPYVRPWTLGLLKNSCKVGLNSKNDVEIFLNNQNNTYLPENSKHKNVQRTSSFVCSKHAIILMAWCSWVVLAILDQFGTTQLCQQIRTQLCMGLFKWPWNLDLFKVQFLQSGGFAIRFFVVSYGDSLIFEMKSIIVYVPIEPEIISFAEIE